MELGPEIEERFAEIDDHLDALFGLDPAYPEILRRSDEAMLPTIAVSSSTGRLLQVLVAVSGAERVLEIGTLGGYSTLWLARALPEGGQLLSLEFNPHHADVARANLASAGVEDRVDIRVGDARVTLAALMDGDTAPFDLAFIDADKESYPEYLEAIVSLARPGTLIVADNVVRGGAIIDRHRDDEILEGIRRFNEALADHPAIGAASINQIVGHKGHDGLAFAVVTDPTAGR